MKCMLLVNIQHHIYMPCVSCSDFGTCAFYFSVLITVNVLNQSCVPSSLTHIPHTLQMGHWRLRLPRPLLSHEIRSLLVVEEAQDDALLPLLHSALKDFC